MDKNQTDSGASVDSQIQVIKRKLEAIELRLTILEQTAKIQQRHHQGGRQLRR